MIWFLLLTILAYSYVWRCGLVSDDTDEMNSKGFKKASLKCWNYAIDNIWIKLFKRNPRKWHLVVLGYHLLTVSLFYLFCSLFFNKQIATVATLLFAVHPCATQGVAWISGRHYTMMGWLALGGLMLASQPLFFIPTFFLAGFLHPHGLALPIVVLLHKFAWWKLSYLLCYPFLYGYYRKWVKSRKEMSKWPEEDVRWKVSRLNMFVKMANYYLFTALVPFRLGFYHSNFFGYKREIDTFNLKTVLGIFSLIVFFSLGIIYRQALPLLLFGFLWFYLFLIPCMNVLHLNMLFSERYMYVPLMGFALALSQILVLIPYYQIILAVILTLYFVRTASYTMAYKDNITLFNANIRNQRNSVEAHINLGDQWIKTQRPDIALPLFQKALELDPQSDIGWFNLGVAQYNLGYPLEAKKSWEKTIEINPHYVNARFNLLRLEKKLEAQKNDGWVKIAEGERVGVI